METNVHFLLIRRDLALVLGKAAVLAHSLRRSNKFADLLKQQRM